MVNYGTGGAGFTWSSNTTTWSGTVGGGGGGSWTPVVPGAAYVKNPASPCVSGGCQAPELAELCRRISDQQHEMFDLLQEKERQMEPTRALWCEQDGHAFSEKDPDFQVMSITGKDKEGKQVTESRTICGPCAVRMKTNIGSARNAPPAELPPVD